MYVGYTVNTKAIFWLENVIKNRTHGFCVIKKKGLLTWSLWSHCVNIWTLYNCIIILSVCYNSSEQVASITMGIFWNRCYSKNSTHRNKAEQVGVALLNLTGIWYPALSPLALPILTEFYMIFFSPFWECWENAWNYASFLIRLCSQFMIFPTFDFTLYKSFEWSILVKKNSRIHYRLCFEEFLNFIFVGVCMRAYAEVVIGISNMLLKNLSERPTFL